MRIDKFLKNSRIIKRRTVAKEACDQGIVYINGKQSKAGDEIKVGDIVEIKFTKPLKFEVLDVSENVKKEDSKELYRILD